LKQYDKNSTFVLGWQKKWTDVSTEKAKRMLWDLARALAFHVLVGAGAIQE
jgi:hypothetical protein